MSRCIFTRQCFGGSLRVGCNWVQGGIATMQQSRSNRGCAKSYSILVEHEKERNNKSWKTFNRDGVYRYSSLHFSSSVSASEVSKFSKMYKKWWDPKYNPLIGMNPVRVQYIINTLSNNQINKEIADNGILKLQGLKALDVGCGGGLLSESLARLGASVTAIDPSTELVEMAKMHGSLDPKVKNNVDYRGGITVEEFLDQHEAGITKGSEDIGRYDIICLLEVIEHATDVESLISTCSKLLKKDSGVLFISTINRNWKSYALAIVGAECIMRYLPVGTHDWNRFLSPAEVREMYMNKLNLKEINVSGMALSSLPPIGILNNNAKWHWRLDPSDTDVNWIGAYQHNYKK